MLEKLLKKYQEDYRCIVKSIYLGILGRYLNEKSPHYAYVFNNYVLSIGKISRAYECSDIEQEVSLSWFLAALRFMKNKPNMTLRSYLIRNTWFDLKCWLKLDTQPPTEFLSSLEEKQKNNFLDLNFLLHGSDKEPFSLLNGYERQLIYLEYKEEKNILQIAKILDRDVKSIRKHQKLIKNKLLQGDSYEREDTTGND